MPIWGTASYHGTMKWTFNRTKELKFDVPTKGPLDNVGARPPCIAPAHSSGPKSTRDFLASRRGNQPRLLQASITARVSRTPWLVVVWTERPRLREYQVFRDGLAGVEQPLNGVCCGAYVPTMKADRAVDMSASQVRVQSQWRATSPGGGLSRRAGIECVRLARGKRLRPDPRHGRSSRTSRRPRRQFPRAPA